MPCTYIILLMKEMHPHFLFWAGLFVFVGAVAWKAFGVSLKDELGDLSFWHQMWLAFLWLSPGKSSCMIFSFETTQLKNHMLFSMETNMTPFYHGSWACWQPSPKVYYQMKQELNFHGLYLEGKKKNKKFLLPVFS